jgi:hypothetical protein
MPLEKRLVGIGRRLQHCDLERFLQYPVDAYGRRIEPLAGPDMARCHLYCTPLLLRSCAPD